MSMPQPTPVNPRRRIPRKTRKQSRRAMIRRVRRRLRGRNPRRSNIKQPLNARQARSRRRIPCLRVHRPHPTRTRPRNNRRRSSGCGVSPTTRAVCCGASFSTSTASGPPAPTATSGRAGEIDCRDYAYGISERNIPVKARIQVSTDQGFWFPAVAGMTDIS